MIHELFLSLNIPDFSFFFCWKIAMPPLPPLKKSLLKTVVLCQDPPFWKFGRRFNPPPPPLSRKGGMHTMFVDRFSGWPCIYHFKADTMNSMNLINICRDLFISYGAPVEFSFDDGLQFTAQVFQKFLQAWGIARCLYLLVSRLFPIQWSCRSRSEVS